MNYFRTFARTVAVAALPVSFLVLSAGAQAPQPQATKTAAPAAAPAKPALVKKLASETASQEAAPKTAKKSTKPAIKKGAAANTKKKPRTRSAHHASKKAAVKRTEKPAASKSATAGAVPAAAMHPTELPELTHGRDPFAALIRPADPNAGHGNLPPGIAGLQVSTVQLQGMVKTSGGMVAVVANPQDRVYFLHDGDHIYDGVVEKIGLDEITFLQQSKDAFGRTVDRDVSKRLYPIAGDEQ